MDTEPKLGGFIGYLDSMGYSVKAFNRLPTATRWDLMDCYLRGMQISCDEEYAEPDEPRAAGWKIAAFWLVAGVIGGFVLYLLGWFIGCLLGLVPMPNAAGGRIRG